MHFDFVDSILERTDDRIVVLKQVSAAEEYLREHFPTFPVLPGVFMLETMIQAARRLLAASDPRFDRHTLETVRALKYNAMVRPGEGLRVEVVRTAAHAGDRFDFKGQGTVVRPGESPGEGEQRTAVSGKFTLRPISAGEAASPPIPSPS